MLRNEKLQNYLNDLGWEHPSDMVSDLIKGGFIEADPEPIPSRPELYAQKAKDWIGSNMSSYFYYASGWSTAGWETVVGERLEHDNDRLRDVFAALVILSKEDGVEL